MVRPRGQVLGGAPAIVMAQIRKDKNTFALVVRFRITANRLSSFKPP